MGETGFGNPAFGRTADRGAGLRPGLAAVRVRMGRWLASPQGGGPAGCSALFEGKRAQGFRLDARFNDQSIAADRILP